MYIPQHFEVTDRNEIFAFIDLNAFGQLISSVEGRPFSTHIPFLISEDKTKIIGHFAKQNPQHTEIENQEVLVTFQGAHGYISPSWYSSPGVPTWNYEAVHIYGNCHLFTEHEKLKSVVDTLTNKYESAFETPWQPKYNSSALSAIVGFEINISEIQCKYKLSQNRPTQDQKQIIEKLDELGSHKLSKAIRRNEL